ncbi:hypothetical protein J4476_02740 [Candidatus Woesearchaeota archaeon]|nr:hypothetical protein [Candidatus Woesearchaeota archaeon]HIH26120.1 hypothetical protein [Nanoarchaeota archaeon]
MGFLDMFKRREEEPDNSALHSMKSSIKNAHTYISKFLDGTKEFQAARRHEEQYNNIKQRLVEMKIFLVEANTLVDKKIKNDITYQSDRLKNTEQLKKAIEMIIKELRDDNSEKDSGVIKFLETEMWNDDRKKRGFPTPQNHELLIHSLDDARVALKDLSFNLDGYNLQTTNPA